MGQESWFSLYLVCRHRPELQVQTTPEEGMKDHIWSLNRDLPHT